MEHFSLVLFRGYKIAAVKWHRTRHLAIYIILVKCRSEALGTVNMTSEWQFLVQGSNDSEIYHKHCLFGFLHCLVK